MRARASLVVLPLVTILAAGCLQGATPTVKTEPGGLVSAETTFVYDALGHLLDPATLPAVRLEALTYAVGQPGPEPQIGATSKGNLFFQALEKTMMSKDHGRTWSQVRGPLTALSTSDPYLYVDPVTDRVFQVNMGGPYGGRGPVPSNVPMPVGTGTMCAHIAWSDDEGANWLANPLDCGPVIGNDHEKLASGPFVDLRPLSADPVYPDAVYYAVNKIYWEPAAPPAPAPDPFNALPEEGGWMSVSFDGGATFPLQSKMFDAGCQGSLHGDIAVAPDGTVYVPHRFCPAPQVAISRDNGRDWTQVVVGEKVGVPDQQKNPAMAVDKAGTVYLAWTGKDNRTHLAHSKDHGATWSDPVVASPPGVGSTLWPTMAAGDDGRIGLAYVGTEETTKGAWAAPNETRWHLYYTYSLDASGTDPTFVTIRATNNDDPVQRGSICVQSDKCRSGNRNLLDFIDVTMDKEGRVYVAYADGCTTPQCLRPDATWLDSRSRDGYVMVLRQGPSLLAEKGTLPTLG